MSLQLNIELPSTPIFIHPSSDSLHHRAHSFQNGETLAGNSRDETVVHGSVRVVASEPTLVSRMKVVWEVSVRRKTLHQYKREWGAAKVLKQFVVNVGEDEMWLDRGVTIFQFIFVLPSDLPPTRTTQFDQFSHTIHARLPSVLPFYTPSISHGLCGMSHHLPAALSTMSGGRPGFTRQASSTSSVKTLINNSSIGEGDHNEKQLKPAMLKSIFGKKLGRPRSATTDGSSSASHLMALPGNIYRTISSPAAILPSTLGALIHDNGQAAISEHRSLHVIRSTEPRDQISTFKWGLNQDVKRLGKLVIDAQSGLFIIGSGFNLSISFTDLSPLTTIHAIGASVVQAITSPGLGGFTAKEVHTETFKVFKNGDARGLNLSQRPLDGTYLWRGGEAQTNAPTSEIAASGKSSSSPPKVSTMVDMENVITDETSLHIHKMVRLPTCDQGIFASTVVPKPPPGDTSSSKDPPPSFSQVTHSIRLEIFHSHLGEDAMGRPLPLVKCKSGRKVLCEGGMRRTWVDRKVRLGDCHLPPKAELPIYTPPPRECPSYAVDLGVDSCGEAHDVESTGNEGCVCRFAVGEVQDRVDGGRQTGEGVGFEAIRDGALSDTSSERGRRGSLLAGKFGDNVVGGGFDGLAA